MDPVTMGLVAGGIGATAGLAGNFVQASSSKKLMAKQFYYNKKMMQNAHQWTVQDLKAAGLNPVLSATQGANAGSGVGLPQAPDYASNMTDAVNSAMQTYMDNKRINNETQVSESTSDLNEANANKARKEAGVIDAKTNQEIKESESRIVKNKAQTNEIKSTIELNKEKTFLTVEQAYKIGWEKEKLARELQLLDKDISLYEIKMILENNPMKTIGEVQNIILNKKFANSAKRRK